MQEISLLQAHMTAFAAGFVLDLIIGDPYSFPHPVRWIGSLIALLDRNLLGELPAEDPYDERRNRARERSSGLVTVCIVISVTLILSILVPAVCYRLSMIAGMAAEAVLTCYCLAATSLRKESMKVYRELVRGDLEGARKAVSMIVGRDTDVLDDKGVIKAAAETVAENFSDGVFAPMLYTAIGGPVLGMTYKAVNTMDSMIGYRNDRYMWYGAPAARLDDAANYIPSRLSALLLIVSSAIMGRAYSARGAYRIWKRDRRKHKSPNAAQTESAAAGSLGIMLAGDAQYFGRVVRKPSIGDDLRPVEADDILRVNRLMMVSSVIGEAACLIIMYLICIMR